MPLKMPSCDLIVSHVIPSVGPGIEIALTVQSGYRLEPPKDASLLTTVTRVAGPLFPDA